MLGSKPQIWPVNTVLLSEDTTSMRVYMYVHFIIQSVEILLIWNHIH